MNQNEVMHIPEYITEGDMMLGEQEEAETWDIPDVPETPIVTTVECDQNSREWLNLINEVIKSETDNKDGLRIVVNNKWNFALLEKPVV